MSMQWKWWVLVFVGVILLGTSSVCDAQNVAMPEGIHAYFAFEQGDRSVVVQGPRNIRGYYYPTDDMDNDIIDTRRYDRYRVEGRFGQGLHFFAADRSYAEVADFRLRYAELPDTRQYEHCDSLALSLWIKTDASHIGSLVSTKTDSALDGFALYLWGNRMQFQFGDGKTAHNVRSGGISIADQQWHQLEVEFNQGTVRFYVDGMPAGESVVDADSIAPNDRPLRLGLYPAKGIRGFNGVMDELIIADNRQAVLKTMEKVAAAHGEAFAQTSAKEILFVECQPVTGNEQHFGASMFHTFYGKPVPLSFWMKGQPDLIESASLVIYLPKTIKVREVFASEHNLPYVKIAANVTEVNRDGIPCMRYETTNFDIAANLKKRNGVTITLALDAQNESVKQGTLYWAMMINGQEVPGYDSNPFEVRFLPPQPVPSEHGRFVVIPYMMPSDAAFFDNDLRQAIADIFLASGIRSTAYFYVNADPQRKSFDDVLRQRGIGHHEISLWYGPIRGQATDEVPYALNDKGISNDHYLCPTQLIASTSYIKDYAENVKNRLARTQDGDWVMLDYEPWSIPGRYCFCEKCLEKFKQQFNLTDDITPSQVKSDYRPQWAQFWCEHSAQLTAIMSDAIRAVNPNLIVCEYTYVFDYDDPDLWRRYWSIPKDLRLHTDSVDNFMLSLYHINYRAAFDSLNQNLRVLAGSDISVIANLARTNVKQGGYTTPQTSLSPQQLYQKAVMCASLGIEEFGLWSGKFIDGQYHVALSQARQLIDRYEQFYFDGQRMDDQFSVTGKGLQKDDFAYTVWQKNDQRLLSIYNFTDKPLVLDVTLNQLDTVSSIVNQTGESLPASRQLQTTIEPFGVQLLTVTP